MTKGIQFSFSMCTKWFVSVHVTSNKQRIVTDHYLEKGEGWMLSRIVRILEILIAWGGLYSRGVAEMFIVG